MEYSELLILAQFKQAGQNKPAVDLSSGIQGIIVSISAKNLERKDAGGLAKSDPFLTIYPFTGDHYKGYKGNDHLIWRTEVRLNLDLVLRSSFFEQLGDYG